MATKRVALAGVLMSTVLLAGCDQNSGGTSGENSAQVKASALQTSAGYPQWNPLGAASTAVGPSQTALNKTDSVILDVSFGGYSSRSIQDSHGEFIELSVPECGVDGEIGNPSLPFKGYFVEVPIGVVPQLAILDDSAATRPISTKVAPKQPPAIDSVNAPPPFALNDATYALDGWVPVQPAEIVRVGFMRGHQVAFIKVHPLQYNPAKGTLRSHQSLRLQVAFTPSLDGARMRGAAEISNPEYEETVQRLVVNYAAPTFSRRTALAATEAPGADYLIIVDDALKGAVDPLAAWKTQKGYSVKIVKKSEIGTTPDAIKTYVQTAFDTWQPVPSYLLLVGDQGNIPSYPVTPDAYGSPFISDLPYSLLQGSDYWPDITVGRLSCDSLSSCNTVVSKILKYDSNPDTGNWYNSTLVAAYYQDDDANCVEDRWFFETGASVYQYMKNSVGHTMLTSFVTGNQCTTYAYCSSSYPHRLSHPANIPSDLAGAFLSSSAATTAITSAIQGGVGLVQHRDHGAETGWGDPSYWVDDVNGLTNGDKTPVVFSINCLTGAFDYSGGDCFCEALQKRPGGGAVGIIGATRVSYSGPNDLLTNGIYTAMWPNYDSSYTGAQYPQSFRPARALNFGKYYLYTYEGDDAYVMYTFRLFHWFGDPEMEYRFHTPQALTNLSYPASLPPGTQSITVSGAPDGALVGLSQAGTALGRAFSQGGAAIVPVNGTIQPASGVTLTVTHHSAIPYVATLQSVGPAGVVSIEKALYDCQGTVQVQLADSDLTGLGQYQLNVNSTTVPQGVMVTLSESPANSGVFAGALALGATGLAVSHGDQIKVTYQDQNTGSGTGATVQDTASASCLPPVISNVQFQNVTAAAAQVCFATNVPTTGAVVWGVAKPPTQTSADATLGTSHCIQLSGLASCTSYNVEVRATDELGHVGIDNQSGGYYNLATKANTEKVALWAPLDTDPGWTKTGDWEFGPPQGKGPSGGADPTAAYSGTNVYGNDLSVDGNYPNNAVNYFLTTTPFSLANLSAPVTLSFYRWLNIESSSYDHARVDVWNGSGWDPIWQFSGSTTTTSTWIKVEYDLSAYAGHTSVQIRWTLDSDSSVVYGGWNIDDIKVVGANLSATCGNTAPTAEAGANQSAVAGAQVILDGSGSFDPDGDPLTYAWTQTAGPTVALSDTHAVKPTFTTPTVAATTVLTFGLVVNDSHQNSPTDTVNVTVSAPNHPPIASAGANQSVTSGSVVTLDASASSDPDGDALTFTWSQTAGPVVVLSDIHAVKPSFTAPVVSAATVLTFAVSVSDGKAPSTASVSVTVSALNHAPIASAGPNQTATSGSAVALNASASTDPDGDPLTFTWSQTAGPVVVLSDVHAVKPSFTAPVVSAATVLTFAVSVSDGKAPSTASVSVTVQPLTISGTITVNSSGRSGVTVTAGATSAVTNASGVYSIVGLANGSYTVTPSLTGYLFTPASRSVTVNGASVTGVDFTAAVRVNQPPAVNAGAARTVTLPATLTINGTVTDDGLPTPPALTMTWSKTSGPGTVTFTPANAATTTVSFSTAGIYRLRLTASDGALSAYGEVQVTVSGSSGPCTGLCSNPTNFTVNGNYQANNLGTGAVCYQTTSVIHGGNCGNFASPRTLSVNGSPRTCNGGNWSSVPAARNGGYCIQTTSGNQSWAYFSTW